MVPITNQNAALPAITAPRAPQGRTNTTVTNNDTAMRVAAIHRVLSTLSVEQQAEIMNVYRDVAGWTAEKVVMAGIITTWEEHALVDAATIRSLEADVEQLTAHMERLNTVVTTSKEKASVDAAKIRSLEADVEELTLDKESLNLVITTSEEKASVDATKIRSLEADVEGLTNNKERLTFGITKLKKKAALDAANFRLLVKALVNNDSKLFMQLPLEFRQYVRRQTKVGRAIIHSVVGLVFVFVGVMGIVVATDEYYASIYRKKDTIFRIVFGFTMMLFSSSKDLLSLLSIVALGFGFSLMIVGSMKASILVLTRSSSPPVPPTNTASVSNAMVPMTNHVDDDDGSNIITKNSTTTKKNHGASSPAVMVVSDTAINADGMVVGVEQTEAAATKTKAVSSFGFKKGFLNTNVSSSSSSATKAKAGKLAETRNEVEPLVPAVISEEADSIDEMELDLFLENGDWEGVGAAAAKLLGEQGGRTGDSKTAPTESQELDLYLENSD